MLVIRIAIVFSLAIRRVCLSRVIRRFTVTEYVSHVRVSSLYGIMAHARANASRGRRGNRGGRRCDCVVEVMQLLKLRDLWTMHRGSMSEQGLGVGIRGANSRYSKIVVQKSTMVRVDR